MKRIIFLGLCFALSFGAYAQVKPTETAGTAIGSTLYLLDTNTNTQTNYYYAPDKYLAGTNGNFTFQLVATKVSGTVVDSVWLESTMDNSNWNSLECPCSFAGTMVVANKITAGKN